MRALVLLLLVACGSDDPVETCDNGTDDDGDGFADCADQDCFDSCSESSCADGKDDDLDGRIDCDDPDCVDECSLACPEGDCSEDCSNGIDDDLDFMVDCADSDCDAVCDADGDGYAGLGGPDCDDSRAEVNPEALEVPYDGLDNDCDVLTLDDDLDGDGFASAADCDDNNGDTYPGAVEVCGNGHLDNCDSTAEPSLDTCYGERSLSTADTTLTIGTADAWVGQSLAAAGDLSGDGVSELMIGAYGENFLGGAVYVVEPPLDAGQVDLASARLKIAAESEDDWVGFSLASGGNSAGGPVPMLAITAVWDDGASNQAGAVYLVSGDETGVVSLELARTKILGGSRADGFGSSVAHAGDFTGNGTSDLVVGGPFVSGNEAGAAYVFAGPIDAGEVQASEAFLRIEGEREGDQAGCAVAGGADVDGDGLFEVAVGACFNDRGAENGGAVFLMRGDNQPGVRSVATAEGGLQGDQVNAGAGAAIAFGDLDGDGGQDLIVGGPGANDDAGRVWAIKGNAPLLAPHFADWDGESPGDHAGSAVSSGDIDGDGQADLIVGAPGHDGVGEDAGAAYVFFGPFIGSGASPDIIFRGVGAFGFAGQSVLGVPDIDGDGRDELMVGSPFLDVGAPGSGAASLITWGW